MVIGIPTFSTVTKFFCLLFGTLFFAFIFYYGPVYAACSSVSSACGGGGCAENEVYRCGCIGDGCVTESNPNPPPLNRSVCLGYAGCECVHKAGCAPACQPDCDGKSCGPNGCGGSCGNCATGVCNGGSCCANSAPAAVTLSAPAAGFQFRTNTARTLSWNATSSWGTNCAGNNNRYQVCVSSNQSSCDYVNNVGVSTSTSYNWTPTTADSTIWWRIRANNGALSTDSSWRAACVEGFNANDTAYVSAWSACNANTHKRTRTCTETCGTDDCTAFVAVNEMEQDCIGEIRGTIFDATDLAACPSFDPATGYLIGVDRTLTANNREFEINDQSTVPTHPWAPITAPQTDSSGNYSVRVYAPATYAYDFTNLRDIYVVSDGPKLTCTSAAAVVPGNPTNCGTQPCSIVNNMSFGFERYWGGWWQVQGAGVHGELGLKTSIPSSLPTEQSMILPEPTTGNRRGVVTYGALTTNMLGVNTNAKVSASLWQALSPYQGVIYDYSYFNQQFKKFATTTWDGVSTLTYDDGGRGYQIVKVAGSVNNFSYSPTGTEKIIFLINGDVTINSNITVPNGAFMAVLSSGGINFGTLVTNADGWYLADHIYIRCVDNDLDSECDRNDNQFVGNGSFVAWEGIIMNRDRGGANNILGPAEKFNYRLDLYNNAPEPMKIVTKRYKPYVP